MQRKSAANKGKSITNNSAEITTKPVITVIVALYNKAATLEKCIESLLKQTQQGIEILLIDDASTDGSAELAKQIAQKHPERIRFLQNKQNLGLGGTENYGVQMAQGQYIGFVDADDYIDKDFYSQLYSAIKKHGTDGACGDFMIEYPSSRNPASLLGDDNLFLQNCDPDTRRHALGNAVVPGQVFAGFWGGSSSCSKLISKEVLKRFPFFEGRRCDDLAAILPLAATCTIAYVPRAYYTYVQSEDSMERNVALEQQMDAFQSIALTLQRYRENGVESDYSELMIAQSFTAVACSMLTNAHYANQPDLAYRICEIVGEKIPHRLLAKWLDIEQNKYLRYALDTIYLANKAVYVEKLGVLQRYFAGAEIRKRPQKNPNLPLVSIVIPAYNAGNYLHEAIDSALAQTYPNIEVVVVNDGARDAGITDLVARTYKSHIQYVYKKNGGTASALNCGIEHMHGEYFSWLSHDDLYEPEKVEAEYELIAKAENKRTVVYCSYKTINPDRETIQEYHIPYHVSSNPKCLVTLDITYTMNGCALLVPKEVFQKLGPFRTDLKYTQDYEMWLRMTEVADFKYLDECLVLSRQHPGQDSRTAGVAVTDEADCYHSQSIAKLQPEEVKTYLRNGLTLEKLYQRYWDYGFPGSATAIMSLWIRQVIAEGNEYRIKQFLTYRLGICKNSVQTLQELYRNLDNSKPIMLVYSNIWVRGGIERVLSVLLPRLTERFRIVLVSAPWENMQGFDLPSEITHIRIDYSHDTPMEVRLGCIALLTHAQIFWGHPNIMPVTLPAYRVMHNNGIKSIAHNHYYYFFPYFEPAFHSVCEDRDKAFDYADIVLWLTNFSAGACKAKHNNVALMPNPISFKCEKKQLKRTPKQLLAVGRFADTQKRFDRVLKLFIEIYKRDPEVSLVVVGNYSFTMMNPMGESIASILASYPGVSGAVKFVGEQKDVRPFYEKGMGLLLASDNEGFPLVLAESGEYGIPAFIYDTPCMEDIIEDGRNGMIEAAPHIERLAERITKLLNQPKQWKQMSEEAYKMAQRYSLDAIMAKWNELFDMLLAEDKKSMAERIEESSLRVQSTIDMHSFSVGISDALRASACLVQHGKVSIPSNNAGLEMQLAQLNSEAAYLTELNKQITESKAWRITKPLRDAHKAIVIVKDKGIRELSRRVKLKYHTWRAKKNTGNK